MADQSGVAPAFFISRDRRYVQHTVHPSLIPHCSPPDLPSLLHLAYARPIPTFITYSFRGAFELVLLVPAPPCPALVPPALAGLMSGLAPASLRPEVDWRGAPGLHLSPLAATLAAAGAAYVNASWIRGKLSHELTEV